MEKQSYFIIGTSCPSAPLASQFTLGIESKFKYFGGEIKKKLNSPRPVDFPPGS